MEFVLILSSNMYRESQSRLFTLCLLIEHMITGFIKTPLYIFSW